MSTNTTRLLESKITKRALDDHSPPTPNSQSTTETGIPGLELVAAHTNTPTSTRGTPSTPTRGNILLQQVGPFANLQPGCTLLGINQKSVRGMSLSQVCRILNKIPVGAEIILLTRCDGEEHHHDHDEHHSVLSNNPDKDHGDPRNVAYSIKTISDRDTKRIATNDTRYSQCCLPVDCECCCPM